MYSKEVLKKQLTELQYRTTHPLTKGPKTQGKHKEPSPLTHTHPIYKIY